MQTIHNEHNKSKLDSMTAKAIVSRIYVLIM